MKVELMLTIKLKAFLLRRLVPNALMPRILGFRVKPPDWVGVENSSLVYVVTDVENSTTSFYQYCVFREIIVDLNLVRLTKYKSDFESFLTRLLLSLTLLLMVIS